MKDTPERALREAEGWLASAMHSLASAGGDEAMPNVVLRPGNPRNNTRE
jgi:hypothetical protein